MGVNNSQPLETKSSLVEHWLPHGLEAGVLVNKLTGQQVQRHFIKILVKDLPREISHFASRMSHHQPFVGRLLYFHPSVPDLRVAEDKQFRQMYLYTDRMVPIRDWSREKVVMALQGFRRLVAVHGPIRITEKMVSENEKGEAKVWMSQNPVNNHPDSKYMSEEQTVADVAAILSKNNKDLAGFMIKSHTLKEALQKLTNLNRQHTSANTNTLKDRSHHASEGGDIRLKKYQFIEKAPSITYRNVFGDIPTPVKPRPSHCHTPTKFRNSDLAQATITKRFQEVKPTSNISQYTGNYYLSLNMKDKVKEQTSAERVLTNKGSVLDTSIQNRGAEMRLENKCKGGRIQGSNQYMPREQSIQSHNHKSGYAFNNAEKKRSPIGVHRFQTSANLGGPTSFPNHASQKVVMTSSNLPFQYTSPSPSYSKQPQHSKRNTSYTTKTPQNLPRTSNKQGYDITIINNNVNNYVNNIVHNHVMTIEKKESGEDIFKARYSESQKEKDKFDVHSSQKDPRKNLGEGVVPGRGKEKSDFVPVFLQQRKKSQNQDEVNNDRAARKVNREYNFLTRQDTLGSSSPWYSNLPQQPANPFVLSNNIKQEQPPTAPQHFQRKTNKTYAYTRQDSSPFMFTSNSQQINSFYPKAPTPNLNVNGASLSSFHQGAQNRPDNVGPLRTKTTQFYRKGKDFKDEALQNKSFTINEAEKESDHPKSLTTLESSFVKQLGELTEPKHILDAKLKQQSNAHNGSPEQKTSLKKQLRQQFKFLLGGDPPKQQPQQPRVQSAAVSVEVEGRREVKERIIKKRMAFAELKMEALKVLTDEQ